MKTVITRTLTADTATITLSTTTRKGAVVGSTTYFHRADGYTVFGVDLPRWADETAAWLAKSAVWPVEYIEA